MNKRTWRQINIGKGDRPGDCAVDCYEYQFTWLYSVNNSLNEILKHCTSNASLAYK
ncbi:hypothetical protein [Pleurocapsa sp. FMAR1]|uniref:hypothetical protein n=1 Tax=Pleurocapsa sp. FMAR1 TaxID=3040204 RepID=UPI0029C90F7A|nr:hypothetical protein [Pleurocapsa sp. FMAR1]